MLSRREEVLAQPTRARLVALLRELGRPAGTDELAELLGLHPNGVRLHLERLREVGLVERRRVVGGRGRPRHAWTPADDRGSAVVAGRRAAGDPAGAGIALSTWLARALPADAVQLVEVEQVGREVGRELAGALEPSAAREAVPAAMTALGFEPHPAGAPEPDRLCLALGNCPYRDAVRANRDAVCTLHRGIVRGVLDVTGPGARLTRFVPHDPDETGCEIEVHGLAS